MEHDEGMTLCSVCGDVIEPEELTTIPATSDPVHRSEPGIEDGCEHRYWDAPGELGLTEESW